MNSEIEPASESRREKDVWQAYAEYLASYPVENRKTFFETGLQLYFDTIHQIMTDAWKTFRESMHAIEVQKQKEYKTHEIRKLNEATQRVEGLRRAKMFTGPFAHSFRSH